MVNYYLAKTDPKTYSIKQFAIDKETNWDGVHNYQALIYIKQWKIGDRILIYNSQGENRIVGLAEVIGEPEKDLNDKRESWYARLRFIKEFSEDKKITLKEIKESGLFGDWYLVRNGRLSTMSCPIEFVEWLKLKGVLE